MENLIPVSKLTMRLRLAARWRKTLANAFPEESRYRAAARLLERLADDLSNVDPQVGAIFCETLSTEDNAERLKRAEDKLIPTIGFTFEPRSLTELIRTISWDVAYPGRSVMPGSLRV